MGAQKPKIAPKPVPVSIVTVKKGNMDVTVNALGTVTSLNTITIKAQVSGQLQKVNYVEGQLVKKGDLLIGIDPRFYQAQVAEDQGQLERDSALLAGAKTDFERYKTALEKNSISKQQLDDQEALVHQYEGSVKLDQGLLENAKVQLGYCQINSPVDGRVGLRLVDEGNIVQPSDTTGLVVITQTQPITVIFSVAEDVLPQIETQLRQGSKLGVQIFDREQLQKQATGELQAVDNEIDPTTGTVKLRAQFANENNLLFPNQFVNVVLVVKTLYDVALIPTAAVQRNGNDAFVYVVGEDQTASIKSVKPGATDGNFVVVEGLDVGATIVTDGFDKLQDGVKVSTGKEGTENVTPAPEKTSTAKSGAGHSAKNPVPQGINPQKHVKDASTEAGKTASSSTKTNSL
jgi:multidrug efflux system membrane fusion protein